MSIPISVLFPAGPDCGLPDLTAMLARLRKAPRLRPFAAEIENLTGNFSQALLSNPEARRFPELQVLGFWLRPAALALLRCDFKPAQGAIAVPQGVVFHIPPANVDTMFAYSLFLSLLAGNATIIRLPSRRGPAMELLLRLIVAAFAAAPASLRDHLFILHYGHDDTITAALSAAADLRVVWGGDRTVQTLRTIPLPPHGREMVFPDRFSWSVLNAAAYAAADDMARQQLATRYANDLFWFDQNGCASPRVIVWCGVASAELTADFYRRLAGIAQVQRRQLDEGGAVLKQTSIYSALIDCGVKAKRDFGDSLTVLSVPPGNVGPLRESAVFGGTLFEMHISELTQLAALAERRDQTLGCFGFTTADLEQFVRLLNGKGFDRLVPIGQALAFEAVWDGYDLLQSFTRLVTVRA